MKSTTIHDFHESFWWKCKPSQTTSDGQRVLALVGYMDLKWVRKGKENYRDINVYRG